MIRGLYINLLKRQADPGGLNSWLTYHADSGILIAAAGGQVLHLSALPSPECAPGRFVLTFCGASDAGALSSLESVGCIRTLATPPPRGLGGTPRLDIRLMPGAGWDRLVELLGKAGGGVLEVRNSNGGASLLLPAVQAAREAARRAQCINNPKN